MSNRKGIFLLLAVSMLSLGVVSAEAQGSTSRSEIKTAAGAEVPEGGVPRFIRPETPEQRATRLGTEEDPGMDPDPKKVFWRFGKQFTIEKFDKQFAKYVAQPGWVRPIGNVNITSEIYQENDKYVWVWIPVPATEEEIKEARPAPPQFDEAATRYFQELRGEFTPLDLPAAGVTVKFEESSNGLPTTGSWRNGGAVADMNADGHVDLVFPPQRGQATSPAIFLGDGKGSWNQWEIRWPRAFNYGTVVVADFNKDKHLDLAFSIHLTGVGVFLGDGKGGFREVTEGLDTNYPTRRMVATDVNADGWTDIVAISEGPVGGRGRDHLNRAHGGMRAYLNRNKGKAFEGINIAEPREYVGGDYLSVGMFNDDRYPDFVGASVYFNSTHTLFLSNGEEHDSATDGLLIPGRSYYHASAAGRFVKGTQKDDFVVSFVRHWPRTLDEKNVPRPPLEMVSGIDRLTYVDGKPTRIPVTRWSGAQRINGMAAGDIDGDGHADIAYVDAPNQEVRILLGDGLGGFKRGSTAGLALEPQRTYDLVLSDLNGDKRLDVLLAYESDETTAFARKNGSIHVYLNRGTERQ